jgi:uncharacterized protein
VGEQRKADIFGGIEGFMARGWRRIDPWFFSELAALAKQLDIGANLLAQLLDDEADRQAIAEQVSEAETEADQISRRIVRRANQARLGAVVREDLYDLATELDAVMDKMDEAADLIMLYEVDELPKEFAKQVTILQRCAELTVAAMPRLGTQHNLEDFWTEMSRLESAGDKQFRRILAKLFDGSSKTLEVIKLKDIISAMESAIDSFKEVSKTVELIVVRRS